MAKKLEAVELGGLRSMMDEEIIIDIHPDGRVSTPWLTTEGDEILKSVGSEPESFKGIANFCG